ncbi:sulfotransferase [Thalassotalea sp. M1531]|uniref:Sulfotransferase n=1 Tax=Thalassotalea algicola TaxID=2716224 RepID=A0A7Y0LG75_9GAMM|nr:sulfotransferase [Thalassotalea algicola]NMP33046.1 sulfotransferase [Thalassotalea algicola]
MREQKTILLFGMPRSGTTWIGKIFDSHQDTYYLHEPDSAQPIKGLPLVVQPNSADAEKVYQATNEWLKVNDEKVTASRPFFEKSYMNFWQFKLYLGSAYLSKLAHKLNLPFFKKPIRKQSTPPVIVWKSIESLARIGAIQKHCDAMAVQILRHPCGNIASTLRGEKQRKFDSSIPVYEDWDLFDKLLKQSGETRFNLADLKAMPPEKRLAIRWGIMNDLALKQVNSDKSIVLVYEDICRSPRSEVEALFEKLNLKLGKETIQFVVGSTEKEDEAYYATNKKPLVAAYKWKDELTELQQKAIFETISLFSSGKYYLDDF